MAYIAMVEPDSMPGNNTFVAGFTQCEYLWHCLRLTCAHGGLANVGDTSPNTWVALGTISNRLANTGLVREPSARALVSLGTANLVNSNTPLVVIRRKIVMVGMCTFILLSVSFPSLMHHAAEVLVSVSPILNRTRSSLSVKLMVQRL